MSVECVTLPVCVVIGASHGGVNFAFSLRKEGWQGRILLFDSDTTLPYHRPPLSKAYLSQDDSGELNLLKSADSYEKQKIELHFGQTITAINRQSKTLSLSNGEQQAYDVLLMATGARALIPPIEGLAEAKHAYPLRTAADVSHIRHAIQSCELKRVVIIGGGYIGLETAASLRKLGAQVTVLEREERILARVTAPYMSAYFQDLHQQQGVKVLTQKNVLSIFTEMQLNMVVCTDGREYAADLIVIGVGIRINHELAQDAALDIDNGIVVNEQAQTSDPSIYAIGDCANHFNPHYQRRIRLESVQNAVDQAKVAAAAICGKSPEYDTIPWFWSDQYDIKLQMVGLSQGYNDVLVRHEPGESAKFSVWYFQDQHLLALDAVNCAKAYVLATKCIKNQQVINKTNLLDTQQSLSAEMLLAP